MPDGSPFARPLSPLRGLALAVRADEPAVALVDWVAATERPAQPAARGVQPGQGRMRRLLPEFCQGRAGAVRNSKRRLMAPATARTRSGPRPGRKALPF